VNSILEMVLKLSRGAQVLAGAALVAIMGLTVFDVSLRSIGKPIVGSYEIVGMMGALVVAFSLPFTSWVRGHIYVDFLVQKLPDAPRKGFHLLTRVLSLVLFFLISWNLYKMGADLQRSGEVSPTLQVPFYPIVFGVGVACLLQGIVLAADIVKIFRGKYE